MPSSYAGARAAQLNRWPRQYSRQLMGTSGTSITSDHTVADVVGTVVDRLKEGATLQEASAFTLRQFKRSLKDSDDGPLIWLAIAHVQWKYGRVDADVLDRVRNDIAAGNGLDRWRDDPADLAARKRALNAFLAKVSEANSKPASPPRSVTRLAPFAAGDCISVLTDSGEYTAAIVLKADNSRSEYGSNLVGSLDYLSRDPPEQKVFEDRRWLFKNHGNWNGAQELAWFIPVGFRKARKRIAVVGKTNIRSSDPQQSNSYANWGLLGQQILLCRPSGGEALRRAICGGG